jgi:5-carboxymethyl-2-hydroxymuconate isomerase
MPHIVIECSANMSSRADLNRLVQRVHAAALGTGVFPLGGLRTRVAQRDLYAIADGDPENAFVHVTVRIGAGRDAAMKRRAAEAIFAATCDALEDAFERSPLGISLELQEIDPDYSLKKNNLHQYVTTRKAAV